MLVASALDGMPWGAEQINIVTPSRHLYYWAMYADALVTLSSQLPEFGLWTMTSFVIAFAAFLALPVAFPTPILGPSPDFPGGTGCNRDSIPVI